MNKLIWKGIDSSTIKGLLICELPPITKPKMRVQETVIDGVDGSIIEELGYESYDKTIKIGLTYDFDIDEIIKYFSGEGEVVFSNEPDKYYKASILNRIDYERLLRFREATVKFRVQPFKYQHQEEKLIAKTGSVDGTEIKISDVKAIQLQIDGRSIQDGTPTPDTPVEIGSLGYENLIGLNNVAEFTSYGLTISVNNNVISIDGTSTSSTGIVIGNLINNINFKNGTNYILSAIETGEKNDTYNIQLRENDTTIIYPYTFELPKTFNDIDGTANKLRIYVPSGIKFTNYTIKLQLEKNSIAHSYIPYSKYGIEVETTGKNKLPFENKPFTLNGITYTCLNGELKIDGTSTGEIYGNNATFQTNFPITLKAGTYTFQFNLDNSITVNCPAQIRKISDGTVLATADGNNTKKVSFTITEETRVNLGFYVYNQVFNNLTLNLMLEEGDTSTPYQPYQRNTSVIAVNEPLRSLPNGVKDIAYIRNNKLYVDRYVGSMYLNGSESWTQRTTGVNSYYIDLDNCKAIWGTQSSYCNYFTYNTDDAWNGTNGFGIDGNGRLTIGIENVTTIDNFKTWLSTNNTQVDYELATPVTEEYGDFAILELVDGENDISNSAETNMVILYGDNKLIINNLGNYVAKPIFEIEGAGTIKFMLNGYSVFTYNFDEDGRVIIDSEKEDAYLDAVLKNRNMNGDFPIFNPGENKFAWDGLIKNISVSKKSRWL